MNFDALQEMDIAALFNTFELAKTVNINEQSEIIIKGKQELKTDSFDGINFYEIFFYIQKLPETCKPGADMIFNGLKWRIASITGDKIKKITIQKRAE